MIMSNIRMNSFSDGKLIAERAGCTFNPLVDVSIARIGDDGNLMGGVVFTNYTGVGGSITIHVGAYHPRWINPDMLWVTFDYPFNQLQVKKLFGQVPSYNQHALEFDLKLGFAPEVVIEDVYPQGAMVLMSMTREQCRFLNMQPRTIGRGSADGR